MFLFPSASNRLLLAVLWLCVLSPPVYALSVEEMESIVSSRVCQGGVEVPHMDCGDPGCSDGSSSNQCYNRWAHCYFKVNPTIDRYNKFVEGCAKAPSDRLREQGGSQKQHGQSRASQPDQPKKKEESDGDRTRRIEAEKRKAKEAEAAMRRGPSIEDVRKENEKWRRAEVAAREARERQSEIDKEAVKRDMNNAQKWLKSQPASLPQECPPGPGQCVRVCPTNILKDCGYVRQ
jgi:hypothetical protein